MKTFKGTPGPWLKEVIKGNIMVTGGKIYPKRPEFNSLSIKVGYISDDDCGNPTCCCTEEHANAQLIAVAPELLEFAIEMVKRYPTSPWIYEKGQELINKALANK